MTYNKCMKLTKVEKAYLAGIIDGEGCISIHKQLGTRQLRKRHILYIHIANTDEKLMQYLLNKVGGNVSRRQVKKKWKISRVWRIGDNKAKELLKQVYPYLILKRKQAKIGFELRETYNNNERFTEKDNHAKFGYLRTQILKDEIYEQRDKLFKQMKKLNKKGAGHG